MLKNFLAMTNGEYHADTTRISKSGLDLIGRSPAHYYQRYLSGRPAPESESPALVLGSAVHAAILEPEAFAREYVLAPKLERRSNAGKEAAAAWEAANVGRRSLEPAQYDTVQRMRDAVFGHATAAAMLGSPGIAEATNYFTHPETGAQCKVRFDFIHHAPGGWILDIKSTEDASPEAFARSVANYQYHKAAAFYSDSIAYAGGQKAPAGFMLIAVEKVPPYGVACYVLNTEAIEVGRGIYHNNLDTYTHCLERGNWAAYSPNVQTLELPRWALKSE